MDPVHQSFINSCGRNVRFEAGEYVAREGEEANAFFAIRHGIVAIELFAPERGAITIQTIGEGEIFGWSWLFPPHRWVFDARAVELTRAIAFDCACLREKIKEDQAMGYEFLNRFSQVIAKRLEGTRLQLLDMYGKAGARS
jgi:CRP-like cAMP-binding protein